jgi:large subunit ribosomal protein L10
MNKAEKTELIQELKEIFSESNCFYVTDCSTLTVAQMNDLRGKCFEKGIKLKVVKNTIIRLALEQVEGKQYSEIYDILHGPSALMFSDNIKDPALLIKAYRETAEKPTLKGAYIDSAVFVGDDQLDSLTKLKTREEMIGEIIGLLQSPATNLIGALQSGGNTIGGLLKALEERAGA